jgi:hypothetical protein
MAAITIISLPREHKAAFPNRCVVCGEYGPDSTIRLITGEIGWWTWILAVFGTPVMIKAPACTGCSWRFHGERCAGLGMATAFFFVIKLLILPMFPGFVPRRLERWAVPGLATLFVLPLLRFGIFFPKSFAVTAYATRIDYEFGVAGLATEFAILNRAAGDVKLNGLTMPWSVFFPEEDSSTETFSGHATHDG